MHLGQHGRDLVLQQPSAVPLHVCLESLLRGPALGLLSMTRLTASDRADLEKESQRGKRSVQERREGRSELRHGRVVETEGVVEMGLSFLPLPLGPECEARLSNSDA